MTSGYKTQGLHTHDISEASIYEQPRCDVEIVMENSVAKDRTRKYPGDRQNVRNSPYLLRPNYLEFFAGTRFGFLLRFVITVCPRCLLLE